MSTHLFAIFLEAPVGVDHLTLGEEKPQAMREKHQELKPLRHSSSIVLGPPYLEFLRLPSHFEQLRDGVDEPLEVMVTHLLDLSVVVSDPRVQLLHEEAMFLTVVHRPGRKEGEDDG